VSSVTQEAESGVRHEPARERFVLASGGGVAVLEYRRVDATTLDYNHTFVPNELRGRGLASALTDGALRYALEHDLTVIPSCPFVAAFIAKHPEYRPLLR
jgi:uncharacterized protein